MSEETQPYQPVPQPAVPAPPMPAAAHPAIPATPPPPPAPPTAWSAGPAAPEPGPSLAPAPPAAPSPVTTPAPAPRASVRGGTGRGTILAAIVATALITSTGTYIAVSGGSRGEAQPAANVTGSQGGTGQQAPGAGQPAPATQAPSTQAPQAPVTDGSVVEVVKAVSPAVVTIVAEGVTSTDALGGVGTGTATGSGVIFDAGGLILTNRHVVSGNPQRLTVNLKDGRSFDAQVYGIDTLTDLAIVKVDQSGLPTAQIGDSASIQVGQQAIAIGSPLGEFTDSVTSGIISAIGRSIDVQDGTRLSNLIQTDTAINPGNSGGPLLDTTGGVIGINTAVAGNAQGIGFAIPIDIAKPLLAQAASGQQLARAWLGVRFQTIDPALKSEANLPVDNGAWIPTVTDPTSGAGNGAPAPSQDPNGNSQDPFGDGTLPDGLEGLLPYLQGQGGQRVAQGPAIVAGSPADQAGLKEGDIITTVNGTDLTQANTLDLVVGQLSPGTTVTLGVLRDGQTTSLQITLGTRPTDI